MNTSHARLSVGPSRACSERLLVLEVLSNVDSKILKAVYPSSGRQVLIALCHEWIDSAVETGHIVRVVLTSPDGTYRPWDATYESDEHPVIVTRDCNLLIHHPDVLIPCTAVADSFMCLRKTVLNYRSPSGKLSDSAAGSEAALFGHLIHDMFQNILARDASVRVSSAQSNVDWSSPGLDIESFFEAAEEALYRHHEGMFAAGVSDKDARLVLHKVASDIMSWYNGFMGGGNVRGAGGVEVQEGKLTRNIVVKEVHDIEELIWSPIFGLKGKVDATVYFRIDGVDMDIGVLELKTGKATGYSALYHSAQVTLYNMLMSDRTDRLVKHALLTYLPYQDALKAVREDQDHPNFSGRKVELLQTQSVIGTQSRHRSVVSSRCETVGLVMQRNRLASYLKLEVPIEELPPLLEGKEEVCAKCFSNESCLIQHKMLERGSSLSVSSGPGAALFEKKTSHLKPDHELYYRFWRSILAQEQNHAGREVKEIWCLTGEDRERKGTCLSGLQLCVSSEIGSAMSSVLLAPGQRIEAKFTRHTELKVLNTPGSRPLTAAGIRDGDYVVISAEKNLKTDRIDFGHSQGAPTWQSGLTNGFVRDISPLSITVAVDRSLGAWIGHQGLRTEDISWRLDCQEVYSSYNVSNRTLENLFAAEETCGTQRLRELVVDLKPPQTRHHCDNGFSKEVVLTSQPLIDMNLNEDQENAVRMSLQAEDYVLILGMPGTGKTTTLAAIVLATALQGRSVLVCSHTNSAVDNLLGKLLDLGFDDFIRLGRNLDVIDPRVHAYHFSTKFTPGKSVSDLERELQEPRVVATTCLGISHPLLVRRSKFDLVVVDEASQILQPICLGPLQFADGPFILVGDHYQLPPLLRSYTGSENLVSNQGTDTKGQGGEAQEAFFFKIMASGHEKSQTESLFRRLCVEHPNAMVALTRQYRMAEEIMDLANVLVYSGSLTCGSAEVGNQVLQMSPLDSEETSCSWLAAVRNPSEKVIFLDVEMNEVESELSREEALSEDEPRKRSSASICDRENEAEAMVVLKVLEGLVEGGVRSRDITVLSPFRAQVGLIRGRTRRSELSSQADLSGARISTIDQYQGKDNNCVVVSFVRNGRRPIGPLLTDWRRVNVALTRAKQKLILIGSGATLRQGCRVLERLIQYLESKQKIFRVEKAM